MKFFLLDGKKLSQVIRDELKEKVNELKKRGITPGLAKILVGDDPASSAYVRMKVKDCESVGIYSEKVEFDKDISQETLLEKIEEYNLSDKIHGILVQLPLPSHIDEKYVIESIKPEKDVDGFHPINVGRMVIDEGTYFRPCTPFGIIKLLEYYKINLKGAHVVIIGRSNIVGKPLANMLLQKKENANATVTVCHSATTNMKDICKTADILIAAMGRPHFVKSDMVKEGAAIVDVGSNRVEDPNTEKGYKFVGDVDFEDVKSKVSAITPVPGGVGPMTRVMLLTNTVESASR